MNLVSNHNVFKEMAVSALRGELKKEGGQVELANKLVDALFGVEGVKGKFFSLVSEGKTTRRSIVEFLSKEMIAISKKEASHSGPIHVVQKIASKMIAADNKEILQGYLVQDKNEVAAGKVIQAQIKSSKQ